MEQFLRLVSGIHEADHRRNGRSREAETRATTAWVLGQMLHILHPIMPYITEELWRQFVGGKNMLIAAKWPVLADTLVKKEAQAEITWLIRLISSVRTVRAELNVPAGGKIRLEIKDANTTTQKHLTTHANVIERMARLSGNPVSPNTCRKVPRRRLSTKRH